MNCASARSRRAPSPQRTAKRALAILTARARSSRPSASPSSSCGLGAKPNARGVPHRRTSTFSSSLLPGGTEGWGTFGTWTSSAWIASSTALTSPSSVAIRSPTSRIRACSALASSPRRLAWPIASEARLRSALRSSTSLRRLRRSPSRATISRISAAPPLSASARSTASGCSRISRRSSTPLLRFDGRLLGLDAGDGADVVVGVQLDDAYAPGVAALGADVGGVEANHLALGRDDQDVVAVPHLEHGDDVAVAAAGLDVDDPLAAAALQPVLLERRPLAEAAVGHREDRQALLDDVRGNHVVALLDLDALDAGRAAAHRSHFLLGEADDHAELRGDHDLPLAVGAPGGDHPVAVLKADRLDAARPRVRVRLELGLLHLALLRREEHGAARREVAHRHARGDRLPLAEREEVDHRLPLRLPPAFRDLVHLEPVDLAERGEEQQKGVGRGDEQVRDDVLLLRLHARHALAAAPLAPIGLDVRPLDVARARDRDDHLLVGEQVLDRELGRLGDDLGPARVAVLLLDREQVLADDRHQLRLGREDALELLDEGEGLLVLLDDLVAL